MVQITYVRKGAKSMRPGRFIYLYNPTKSELTDAKIRAELFNIPRIYVHHTRRKIQ